MTRAIIFDVDGTLVDTVDYHARAWQEALEHFGHKVSFTEVREQIGKGGDQLLPMFLSVQEFNQSGKEIENYRSDLYKRKYLPHARAFPKVRELFQKIQASGQSIGLGSSCKRDELAVYKKLAKIDDLPTVDTSSDDVDKSKPHPDIFDMALRRLNVTAAEAITVGDSPYDAIAASKIGLRAIGLLCGGFPENWLRTAGYIAIFRDPADFLENYDRSPAR
jgi:HAD superfamily hydrolase (TIGR01549 family)